MAKILVETILSYKMTYLVEASNEEYAKDDVIMTTDKEEIHQEFLGELICGTQKLSKSQYINFLNKHKISEDHAEKYTLGKQIWDCTDINYGKN